MGADQRDAMVAGLDGLSTGVGEAGIVGKSPSALAGLDCAAVATAVGKPGLELECYGCLESTNLLIKEAIRTQRQPGLVVCALKQEGGYGRQGRTWVSPVGGLYTSLFVKPHQDIHQLPSLSPLTALAVVQAVEDLMLDAGLDCQCMPAAPSIKWPNDVVVDGRKLCGISVELVGNAVCLGFGVNLFEPAGSMDVGGKNTPAYLSRLLLRDDSVAGVDLTPAQREFAQKVLAALLKRFYGLFDRWDRGGFPVIRQEYVSRATLVGQNVSMRNISDDQITSGVVVGFDDQAQLLLRKPSGEVLPVSYGEVHILK